MKMSRVSVIALIASLAGSVVAAQGRRGNPDAEQQAPGGRRGGAAAGEQAATNAERGRPPEERQSVTHHTARIGGQEIAYTATAGTYIIRDDAGTPKATMFFVAY